MNVSLTKKTAVLAVMLACLPVVSPAQEASPPGRGAARADLLIRLLGGDGVVRLAPGSHAVDVVDPLRLDESVAFALKNNFEIQAAAAKTDSADWEVAGAYAAYLPTVSYSQSNGTEHSAPAAYSVNDVRVVDSKHHRRDKSLTISQPLIDPSLIADILLRHKSQKAADVEAAGTRERVALQTVSAYFRVVQAHLFIRFAETYKSSLDSLNQLMSSRVEGGGAAQADLDRIKARSVSAESAIIETKSEFIAALDEFRRLTGVTPGQFRIPGVLMPDVPPGLDQALGKANAANPEYLLSQIQADVQEYESDKAFSRFLPKLSFEFSRTRTWNAGGAALGAPAAGGDDVFPYQNEQRAMLVTTWTFSGGTEIAQGMAASAKAREATYKSMDTRAKVEETVRISFNALSAAEMRVPVLEQAVQSNMRVVEAFEEQYRNGARPLFDLLDAHERLYSARLDLARVLLSEAYAAYQVRRQMGELIPALKESEFRATNGATKPSED